MSIQFPTNLDSFTNPTGTDLLENSNAALDHDIQHSNANDAIEALEAKVGVDGSAVTTSHDYKLSEVTSSDKAVGKTATQTLTNKTLTSPVINVGSDATGDLYYRNAGVLTRIPIGTSTHILTSNGSTPSWQANAAGSDASTTVKGVAEEATQAEVDAGTTTGSTGARLFVNPSTLRRNAIFGDGSDGSVTVNSGSFSSGPITSNTLTRDAFFTNLTINSTYSLNPGGYRIFVSGTLTVDGSIVRNGNNGTAGTAGTNSTSDGNTSGGAGGNGGSALSSGTIKGSLAGSNGGGGSNAGLIGGTAGTAGVAETYGVSSSNGVAGSTGGTSGYGGTSSSGNAGGAGGSAGATTRVSTFGSPDLIINPYMAGNFIGITGSGGGGGGGGGGRMEGLAGSAAGGGGGGGAGSNGGIIIIIAKTIVVGASGSITANGGTGGAGGAGGSASGGSGSRNAGGGGGGGGAGGNGGGICLVYTSYTNSGSVTASAGTGGSAGAGGSGTGTGVASAGTAGSNGNAGVVVTIQI